MITVFTATYNRSSLLPRLYNSLLRQTDTDFEWLVVDDGSTDGTDELMHSYTENRNPFPIRYIKKANGGKHSAINVGTKEAAGEWFFMVDSDDWLSEDAIQILKKRCAEINNDPSFCAVTVLKVNEKGDEVGSVCNYDILDTDFYTYRYKYRIIGDRAECVRTSVMREFPFPVYAGEVYIPETAIWIPMSQKYKMRYTNDKLYMCEYQQSGLTKSGDTIFKRSPLGCAYESIVMFNHRDISRFQRLLAAVRYFDRIGNAKRSGRTIPKELEMPDSMRFYKYPATILLTFKSKLLGLRSFLEKL